MEFISAVCRQGHIMGNRSGEVLRMELEQLLQKQSETLGAGLSGKANEMEIFEYEIRQEVIREMCQRLARSASS